MSLVAAAVGAGVSGVLGLAVPTLVARLPEPAEPHPDAEEDRPDGAGPEPEEPKERYADIAALPGLAWRAALASAVVGALVAGAIGLAWPLLHLLPLVPVGVALALVDWRTRLLPTRLIAPSYALVAASLLVGWLATRETGDLARAGLGFLVAGGLYFAMWFIRPAAMGYGDVRLSGVLGLVLGQLGWAQLLFGVWVAFLLGGVAGLLLSRLGVVARDANPFGPWMLLGAVVGIVWGADVVAALYG